MCDKGSGSGKSFAKWPFWILFYEYTEDVHASTANSTRWYFERSAFIPLNQFSFSGKFLLVFVTFPVHLYSNVFVLLYFTLLHYQRMRSIFAICLILVTCPFLLDFILVLLLAGFPCKLCPPGSFNNETRAQTCECCPDGYTSTYMKTSCRPCPFNEWAKHENFPNCSLCQTCFTPEDCEYLFLLTL